MADERPWRLGLKIGTAISQSKAYIGWAALTMKAVSGELHTGPVFADRVQAIVDLAAKQDGDGVIELHRFTATTFHSSRAARDGMTLAEHHADVDAMADALRRRGVNVEVVDS